MIAGNVTHRAFVLGPSLRDAKPGHGALIVDGEVRARAPAVVDPATTVRAVARMLGAVGERLEPGERILAGSIVQVPLARGERVAAEIDGLGRVDAVIAD